MGIFVHLIEWNRNLKKVNKNVYGYSVNKFTEK